MVIGTHAALPGGHLSRSRTTDVAPPCPVHETRRGNMRSVTWANVNGRSNGPTRLARRPVSCSALSGRRLIGDALALFDDGLIDLGNRGLVGEGDVIVVVEGSAHPLPEACAASAHVHL